jgi:cell fate (sporulation/competence/biofilm development) regulator YlbF (YheA/YmcA/DUF963 family)
METITEISPVLRKTKELCQTILDEPAMQSIRRRIDTFLGNEQARAQYEGVMTKGQALQQKQQHALELSREEVDDFEQHRDELLKNPVARDFIDAQEEMHNVQESIHHYVSKTFELGRLPTEEELNGNCCGGHGHEGGGCGCGH